MSSQGIDLKVPLRKKRTRSFNNWHDRWTRRMAASILRVGFGAASALADGLTVFATSCLAGSIYDAIGYHYVGVPNAFIALGAFVALLFVVFNTLRQEYQISNYLTFAGHARRMFLVWNLSFLMALVSLILTRETTEVSRGSIVLFYSLGVCAVIAVRAFAVSQVKSNALIGKVSAIRVVLVGHEDEIRQFTTRYTPWAFGLDIAASFVLRGTDTLEEDLALAAASARVLQPDDIFILLPWSQTAAVEACVKALVKVPASLHFGPQAILDRFSNVNISRIGKIYSFQIVRHPIAPTDIVIKRIFDLAVAIPLLIALTPVLVLIALAIRLDSPGPALFRQRRYGFNQESFHIFKFRSMTVTEDGRSVRQAVRDDPRVTRVGRFLRRYNLDELPQLLNVVRGEMSLVGPRPHALVHNQHYERSIADYARRHNVKPGITGWAQIHGLRGEVKVESMMRERVDHDLYYIDNWTLGLDIRILVMTIISPKAFTNAY